MWESPKRNGCSHGAARALVATWARSQESTHSKQNCDERAPTFRLLIAPRDSSATRVLCLRRSTLCVEKISLGRCILVPVLVSALAEAKGCTVTAPPPPRATPTHTRSTTGAWILASTAVVLLRSMGVQWYGRPSVPNAMCTRARAHTLYYTCAHPALRMCTRRAHIHPLNSRFVRADVGRSIARWSARQTVATRSSVRRLRIQNDRARYCASMHSLSIPPRFVRSTQQQPQSPRPRLASVHVDHRTVC